MTEYAIRETRPDDAGALISYIKRLLGEPQINLISTADEFTMTVEQERRFISDMLLADNSVMLLAEADGQVIGEVSCRGDSRQAKHHVGVIGISVALAWRDRGVGTALMRAVIDRARATGVLSRLELLVYMRNERAVHVYQQLGFQIEGRKRRAVYRYGEYHDEYLMALLL